METGELLQAILPKERIKTRLIDLVSYASDAGFYYLRPKAVVQPINETEIVRLFEFSHQHGIPLTFRTGGTSLSGQSVSDGILADLSQYWNQLTIEQGGSMVRVKPGITGGMVNAYLRKYKRKIGPDPSSIDAAMMGGILSNNSSGMCCGVHLNSYHTTKYIRFILPDGQAYSTEKPEDYTRFQQSCATICDTILQLRQQILASPVLHERIRKKYLTKNTVGYSLNALIDHSHPLDILAHLLIGAEGTLAFIAEAVMQTIADYPCKATAMLYFNNIYAACNAIVPLTISGAEAVELMDSASLLSVKDLKGVPSRLKTLPPGAAALLIEYQAETPALLHEKINTFSLSAVEFSLLDAVAFTQNKEEQALLWKLRKGLFPAVGALKASGETVILEDIAFPVDRLADAILDLQKIFTAHGYHQAIIFGHAKDGNIHFVITQSFNTPAEIERYDRFLQDVVNLVIHKYDGTLKAEHGTGRNMSPFVETEWGTEAYAVMKALKNAIDPLNLLNPGVIINNNKKAHIADLKMMPSVEVEVDKCIECGYCEPKCPSRDITLTPRRRIVVRREMEILKKAGDKEKYDQLVKEYQYDGMETCAVDGLCATACPVDINTGDLIKRLRREQHSATANKMAVWVARHFKTVSGLAAFGISAGNQMNHVLGDRFMRKFTGTIKRLIPDFPLWSNELKAIDKDSRKLIKGVAPATGSAVSVVYFPTCISRMMGGAMNNKKSMPATFVSVCSKAGINVIIDPAIKSHCCGQLFSSKGFKDAYASASNSTIENLWVATKEGLHPVVLDVSSCTQTLQHCRAVLSDENKARFDKLTIIDSIDFLHDYAIPVLSNIRKKESIVLHPVCSLQKMGLEKKLLAVAAHFATSVKVPLAAGCCGMAGDRGFLFPELTAAATAREAKEIKEKKYDGYYSSAKTCEIAMSDAVGENYESILYMVDECTG